MKIFFKLLFICLFISSAHLGYAQKVEMSYNAQIGVYDRSGKDLEFKNVGKDSLWLFPPIKDSLEAMRALLNLLVKEGMAHRFQKRFRNGENTENSWFDSVRNVKQHYPYNYNYFVGRPPGDFLYWLNDTLHVVGDAINFIEINGEVFEIWRITSAEIKPIKRNWYDSLPRVDTFRMNNGDSIVFRTDYNGVFILNNGRWTYSMPLVLPKN